MAAELLQSPYGQPERITLSIVAPVASNSPVRRVPAALPVLGALALIALSRLLWIGRAALLRDEAYYWDWSRHLDTGYFDHPPLVAWIIRLTTALAGSSELTVRLGMVVMAVGTAALAYRAGVLLGGQLAGWLCLLMTASCPLLVMTSSVATPDSVLLFFWSATVYSLLLAITTERGRYWYIAGLLLGLAMLAKYMAIFLAPSVLLFLFLSGRRWLFRREPYLAGGIALIVFSPNLWWNMQHHWVTVLFQLGHGAAQADSGHVGIGRAMATYAIAQAGSVGPLLALLLSAGTVAALVCGLCRGDESLVLLACCTLVIGGFFLLVRGLVYWDAPAYFSAIICTGVFLARVLRQISGRRRALLAAYCALAVLSGGGVSAYAVLMLAGGASLPGPAARIDVVLIEQQFPWREVGRDLDRVLRQLSPEQQHRAVLFADRFETAGEMAFYTPGHPRIYSGSHQYNLWGSPEGVQGPLVFIGDIRQLDPVAAPLRQGARVVADVSMQAGSQVRRLRIPMQIMDAVTVGSADHIRSLHIAVLPSRAIAPESATFLMARTVVCGCQFWPWQSFAARFHWSPFGSTVATPQRSRHLAWSPYGLPCVSPRTELDICRLQKGDILLNTSRFQGSSIVASLARGLVREGISYWFHAGLYDGAGHVLEAGGPNSAHPDREVQATPIQETGFYGTGAWSDATDWVVLRVKPRYQATVERALAWAHTRAADPSVRFFKETAAIDALAFIDPRNKAQDLRFYCSLFVWHAFAQAGLDLDYNNALLRFDFPLPLAVLLSKQVRSDDLYASAFGPFAVTSVVQDKQSPAERMLTIASHYELAIACIGSYAHGHELLPAIGVAGVACLYRRRRKSQRRVANEGYVWRVAGSALGRPTSTRGTTNGTGRMDPERMHLPGSL